MAAGVQGRLLRRLCYYERVIAGLAALLLIKPGLITDLIGGILIVLSLTIQRLYPYSAKLDMNSEKVIV